MRSLIDTKYLTITARGAMPKPSGNEAQKVLLSFAGIGFGMGGADVQKAEFFGAGRSFDTTFFITDKTRSWGSRLDFNEIGG